MKIKHEGIWTHRLEDSGPQAPRERAFAEHWTKVNKDDNILQQLCMTPGNPFTHPANSGSKPVFIVEQRDATIVASVVQWLGTNIGWCWLEEAVEKAGYRLVKR